MMDYNNSIAMSSSMPNLPSFGCHERKMHCMLSDSMIDKCRMVPHKLDMPIFVDGPVNNTISSPLIMLPGMIPHEHSRIVMPTHRRLQRQINQQTRFDPDLIDANYNDLQNGQSIFKKVKKGLGRFGRYVRRGLRDLWCLQVESQTSM
jgi:hypothetical protein